MISNPRHGSPPRLMAHQPTRFTAAQKSKPSPSPGIRITGFSIRLGLAGHKRLFEFRPNRIQIRAEHCAAPKRSKESRSDGPPRLNIAAPMQATDNTALAVNAPARQDTARTLWDQRRKRQGQ